MDIPEVLTNLPLWFFLVVVSLLLLYLHGTWTFNTWSRQGIRGPYPIPYMGNLLGALLEGGFFRSDRRWIAKYGKLIGNYIGRKPQLLCSDPEFLRKAMIKEFSSMPNRVLFDRNDILDSSMFFLSDDHWRHVRSSLTPTFTSGKLKQMMPLIDNCCLRFVEHVRETKGQPFNTKEFSGAFTMDVIASTAFGIEVDSQKNPDDPILVNAAAFFGIIRVRNWLERLWLMAVVLIMIFLPKKITRLLNNIGITMSNRKASKYFEELCTKILEDRDNGSDRKDLVQVCREQWVREVKPDDSDTRKGSNGVLWSTKGLTTTEIVANAVLFFVAGFDTSSTVLNFALYELAVNQDVQDKVYEELSAHCESVVNQDSLSKLDYLDCVVNEVLRMYPPVPRVDRVVSKTVEIDGVVVPAGSVMTAMAYAMHYDPELWLNPDDFNPERFSPENSAGRHQCAFIPFGIGNRNCIGMRLALLEIKMALVYILKNFRLETCATTPRKPLEMKPNFQMHSLKPIEVKAVAR